MKAEEKIVEALEYVQRRGIKLTRRAVFDWCAEYRDDFNRKRYKLADSPTECCALGALLLLHSKESLVSPEGFKEGWLKEVANILDKPQFWVWKFIRGWDYSNELKFEGKNGKIKEDPVSKWANRLAIEYIDKRR